MITNEQVESCVSLVHLGGSEYCGIVLSSSKVYFCTFGSPGLDSGSPALDLGSQGLDLGSPFHMCNPGVSGHGVMRRRINSIVAEVDMRIREDQ